MRLKRFPRFLSLLLALLFALTTMASAMTVDEARMLLRRYYVDPIPEEVLSLPTIDEITAALGDPFTYYISPEDVAETESGLSDDTTAVGIGVMVELRSTGLFIIRVAPGSPAQAADIQAGDLIVVVNGTTVEEAGTPDALLALIVGDKGTSVTLTFERGGQRFDRQLTRSDVVFPNMEHSIEDGHIAWISCYSFDESTGDDFGDFILADDDSADRWVVDLRGNPGGIVGSALQAVSYVIGKQEAAYFSFQDRSIYPLRSDGHTAASAPILTEPLIVLTDNMSASASELYAAALRDYDAALLIGERTFGKGIGQGLYGAPDGSMMRITSFRYYSPNNITPDHSGVLPHLVVDPQLAPRVATLLSGSAVAEPSADALVLSLVNRDWYIHREDATGAGRSAFAALLEALPADVPLTLNGQKVTVDEVAAAWGVDYRTRTFTDLTGSPYADAIDHLGVLGLVGGGGDGTFAPQGQLTRAELCALLTQALGLWSWDNGGPLPFTDVPDDAWYANPVRILYHLGYVEGMGDGTFQPNALVSHEQFLTILGRIARYLDLTVWNRFEHLTDSALSSPSVQRFSPWARSSAHMSQLLNYTCKPLSDIAPAAPVKREEAAATVYHLMRYMGIF